MPSLTQYTTPKNEVSVYVDDIADSDYVKSQLKKLIAAYPKVTNDFIILLTERVIDNKFTKARVRDAVNNLIDTFVYEVPKVADIVSFDRRIKVFTYTDLCDKVERGERFDDYVRTKAGRYILKDDVENYRLSHLIGQT
jgi:hypothetical protein